MRTAYYGNLTRPSSCPPHVSGISRRLGGTRTKVSSPASLGFGGPEWFPNKGGGKGGAAWKMGARRPGRAVRPGSVALPPGYLPVTSHGAQPGPRAWAAAARKPRELFGCEFLQAGRILTIWRKCRLSFFSRPCLTSRGVVWCSGHSLRAFRLEFRSLLPHLLTHSGAFG